jgi:hypothetical protein
MSGQQPRQPAGSPEGGRFASAGCAATYRLLARREPSEAEPVVQLGPGRWAVWAPRCPHGHFRGCRQQGCR